MEPWLKEVYQYYSTWKSWDKLSLNDPIDRSETKMFGIELKRTDIKKPAKILEVGFGNGRFLKYASEIGFKCSGVEIVSNEIENLQKLGIDAKIGKISDFPKNEFDLVAAFDVFEHLNKQEILDNLKAINLCLKKRGKLLARFPNAVSPFGIIYQYGDITHRTALSGESFAQLGAVAGLTLVSINNAAFTWTGSSFVKSIIKSLLIVMIKCIELFIGLLFPKQIILLHPNITVVLEKTHSIHHSD